MGKPKARACPEPVVENSPPVGGRFHTQSKLFKTTLFPVGAEARRAGRLQARHRLPLHAPSSPAARCLTQLVVSVGRTELAWGWGLLGSAAQ